MHQIQSQTSTAFLLNQQRQRQTLPNESMLKKDEPIKSRPGRKKKYHLDRAECEKMPTTPSSLSPSTSSEYYTNERVPPPAHAHVPSNQQSNGSPNYNFNSFHNHNSTMISHHPTIPSHHYHHHHHHAISHPYFPSFPMSLGVSDYSTTTDLNLSSVSMIANDSIGTPSVSSSTCYSPNETREDEQPKVIVPNIEEELGFLAENNRSGSIQLPSSTQIQQAASASATAATTPNHSANHLTLLGAANNVLQSPQSQSNHQQTHMQQHQSHANQNANNSQSSSSNQMSQQKTPLTDKKFPTPTGPGSGFMQSYLKFLQGERDTSPPPVHNRGGSGGRKTWSRTTNQSGAGAAQVSAAQPTNVNQTTNAKNQMSNGMNVHSNMMSGGVYDRKRTGPPVDDDDSSDSSSAKQSSMNKTQNKKHAPQNIVERAPQVPINAAKKGRTTQSSHNNSFLSSSQQSTTQQNNPIGLQQNPQLLMQQHVGTSQILGQQQMYYTPQDEGSASHFSSYFDYLRRQKW